MEKETSRGAAGGNNEASSYLESETKQNKLLERWRKEVFDGLLRNKRYELLIKDNLARYTKDLDALKTELKSAKNETALTKNKISVLENEASFNQESHQKGIESMNKMSRQMHQVKEENIIMKQSLKGLTMQCEAVMAGFLKQIQQQDAHIQVLTQKLTNINAKAGQVVQAQNDKRIQLLSTFDKKDSELKTKIAKFEMAL